MRFAGPKLVSSWGVHEFSSLYGYIGKLFKHEGWVLFIFEPIPVLKPVPGIRY